MTDKRSILEQVKLDQEAFARLSPVQQQAATNELRSIGFNPSVEFGSSDDKLRGCSQPYLPMMMWRR
jgi:hypothetical protein